MNHMKDFEEATAAFSARLTEATERASTMMQNPVRLMALYGAYSMAGKPYGDDDGLTGMGRWAIEREILPVLQAEAEAIRHRHGARNRALSGN